MKLRTITDFALHSTTRPKHIVNHGIRGSRADFKGPSETLCFSMLRCLEAPWRPAGAAAAASGHHVPVRSFSDWAGSALRAIARFTAEIMARSEAVMIFECIPAPNNVRRARVVISI